MKIDSNAARRALCLASAWALAAGSAAAGDWKLEPFAIKNKQAGFKASLTGYIQGDFRAFGWDVEESIQRAEDSDIRRLRSGVEVEWKKLALDFDIDWTNSARNLASIGQPPYDNPEMKNLYAQYEFAKWFSLRAGTFKVPVSYEFLTSAGKTDMVERSLLANTLGPDRDWGVMALGEIKNRLNYSLGVFAGDSRTGISRSDTTVAGRFVFAAWKPLDVAASFSVADVKAEPDGAGTDPLPKGIRGTSPSGWRFYDRKFVNGQRLRWGLDSQYTHKGFQLKGEFLQLREERKGQGSTFTDLPIEIGTGWSVTATCILTGEKKQRTLKPNKSLFKGGPGLIELAAKFESLKIDDAGPSSGFEGAGNRARNLRPAQDRILWGGVSWLPSAWMRVYGDVYVERYLDALLAPEPPGARFVSDPKGRGDYVTFVARVQFMIP